MLVIEFHHLSKDWWLAVRGEIDTPTTRNKPVPENRKGETFDQLYTHNSKSHDFRTYVSTNAARLRICMRAVVRMPPSSKPSTNQ